MSDYIKIKWGSGCTFADVWYGDMNHTESYMDHLFIPARNADTLEPLYEIIRKDSQEREGRTISPAKISRKTYRVTFVASEVVCDTLAMIPLAEQVIVQFPDDTAISIKGDDVTLNFGDVNYDGHSNQIFFRVEILLIAHVTKKISCCSATEYIEDDDTIPTITSDSVTTDEISLTGTGPDNYNVQSYYKEFYQDKTSTNTIYKMAMHSELGGWFITTDKKIGVTTDGFLTQSIKYTSADDLLNIDCISANRAVACGVSGKLYVTIDGGTNWSVHTTAHGNDLYAVRIRTNETLMCCGDNGRLYCVPDFHAGCTFVLQTTGMVDKLMALDFVTLSNNKWIIVGETKTLWGTFSSYAVDNSPTLVATVGINWRGVTFTGNTAYACAVDGTIKKSTDYGASWTNVSSGTYTKFNSSCLTEHGVLLVGSEDVIIVADGTLIQVLDGIATERTGCAGNVSGASYYATVGTKILNGNHAFTADGTATVAQLVNGECVVTVPTTARTYIVYLTAYSHNYTGSSSIERVVKVP